MKEHSILLIESSIKYKFLKNISINIYKLLKIEINKKE